VSRLLPLALLPFALALAWLARDQVGAARGAPDEETAAHLRRIELSLAEGQAPLADGFLDPPRGAALPSPPFLDGGLALVAGRLLGQALQHDQGTAIGEGEIERLLAWLGPLAGVLGALGVALLALALVHDEWSGMAALIAALAFALWPGALEFGAAGRLHTAAILAPLCAFALAVLAQTSTSKDAFDWAQGGMSGGLFAALALLLAPGSLLFVPVLAYGFWYLMKRADDDRRHGARRAGLLFALTAAVVTGLASGGLAGHGPAQSWVRGASELAFAAGAPFLVVGALPGAGTHAGSRLARAVGALVAFGLLPMAAWHLWLGSRIGAGAWWAAPLELPGPRAWLALVLVLVAAGSLWRVPSWTVRGLARLAVLLAPLSLVAPAAAGPAAAVAGATLAVAVVHAPLRLRLRLATALVAILAVAALTRVEPEAERELASALRRARALLPAEAWSNSTARAGGSWLAPWTLGHRIAFLARRPPTTSGFGPGLTPKRAREAAAVLASVTEAQLAEGMQRLGAQVVLGGRAIESAWPAVEALGGETPFAGTALGRLSSGAPAPGSLFVPLITLGGGDPPLLVAYGLVGKDGSSRAQPSMQAR
jgi:hypothetical protein